jgi:hypothetical protein
MRAPLLKLTGLLLLGLLVTPAGVRTATAQTGTPKPQLEEILYQNLLDNLAAEASQPAPPRSPTKSAVTAASTNKSSATMRCLPTCDTTDGRFLAIAGQNLATLSGSDLNLQISVPAAATSFTVGVFDGDARGVDAAGISHWDTGVTNAIYEYTLYADPAADGTGTTVVEMVPGNPVLTGSMMPDNAWIDFTIPTDSAARAPSGHFFYHLKIVLKTPSLTSLNAFKVRTDAIISGLTLNPVARPFSYIVNPTNTADLRILYPSFPAATPTTYDGTFSFYLDVPTSQPSLTVWDGDFDRGKFDGTDLDTDDPDTPNAPFRPAWATVDTVPEGVAVGLPGTTGNPPDDRNPAGSGIYSLRSPSIRYDLIFPDGQTFANENPSGNLEWEQFKISTDPFDRSQMDYNTNVIPPGTYLLRIQGVDLVNLNALLLPNKVVCIDDLGTPCALLRPFALGDTVFVDSDADHNQGPGEPGISGVVLELRDTAGFLLGTTTTDVDGHYRFEVDAGAYQVVVAASNFDAGGPLSGYIATIADQITDTVTTDNVLTYDFGYRGTGSIGNRVWLDMNANGVQDSGETGINGVTVQLLDSLGNVVASTTTSGDGNYIFSNLAPGTYTISVDAATLPAGGRAPSFDVDGTGTANTATVQLAAGSNRTDVDFGYHGNASIGDRVWYDLNGNGVQDASETGLNGVTVRLFDGSGNLLATTTTAGNGNYSFNNLLPGTYRVTVDPASLPAGTVATFDVDGVATPNTASVILGAGDARTDVDFGERGNASVGDRLWYDLNGNGAQDTGEAGINGATVQLLDSASNVIATATTAGNGNYTFANLLAGTYSVQVIASTLPAGLAPSFDLDGTSTPNVATVQLTAGTSRTDVDFGYRGTTSLGDRVWYDLNGNGVQDSGEAGINGVTVQLLDSGGNVIATKTTSGDGNYLFTDLVAGTYTIRVVASSLPAGLIETYDLDGTGTQHTATVTLTTGSSRNDVDFGYRGTASIGDRVWSDTNGNGVQDSGEAGINGVTVQLLDSTGTVIATTTTSGDGNYTFRNLLAGNYTVKVTSTTLPAGVTPSFDLDGTGTANTAAVTLTGGQMRTDVDFGYKSQASGSIGDRIWYDRNGNGCQDAGETGINGVTVQLYNSSNVLVATTVTSGDGNYTFPGLAAGTYTVKVVSSTLPAGATPTFDKDGTGTPNVATVTLASGQTRTDVDFGYRGTFCLGDRVWKDLDGDGVQDSGEPGLSSVKVQLLDANGTVVATTTTNSNGNYSFSGLLGGTYQVRIDTTTLPSGLAPTYDLDGIATANVATFTLSQSRSDVDFGYRTPPVAPGTGTIGYWKTHSSAWPVSQITVGGVTYTKTQAINWLGTASTGDKTIDLFKQLVAAKLNVMVGNNSSCINDTITAADNWLRTYPLGSNVSASSSAWQVGGPLQSKLDDYNNGLLCAPHRSS